MKKLLAYDDKGAALFYRLVSNKMEAKDEVIRNKFYKRVAVVKYAGRLYKIDEINKWNNGRNYENNFSLYS